MVIDLTPEDLTYLRGALLFMLVTHKDMAEEGKLIFDHAGIQALLQEAEDAVTLQSELKRLIARLSI